MPWGPEEWDAWAVADARDEADATREHAALADLLKRLPGRERMTAADLGCGRGDWIPFLTRHFAQVVAVDYAPASLATARGRCADHRVIFRRRDLRDLTPFRGTIHVALAVESIVGPTPADVDRVLSQIRNALVEGGLLVATFPAHRVRPGLVKMRLRHDDVAEKGSLRFTEVDLRYRLALAGFRGVRFRRFDGSVGRTPVILAVARRRANN